MLSSQMELPSFLLSFEQTEAAILLSGIHDNYRMTVSQTNIVAASNYKFLVRLGVNIPSGIANLTF